MWTAEDSSRAERRAREAFGVNWHSANLRDTNECLPRRTQASGSTTPKMEFSDMFRSVRVEHRANALNMWSTFSSNSFVLKSSEVRDLVDMRRLCMASALSSIEKKRDQIRDEIRLD